MYFYGINIDINQMGWMIHTKYGEMVPETAFYGTRIRDKDIPQCSVMQITSHFY